MIQFNCPSCGKVYQIKDVHAGKRTKCPKCGQTIHVPREEFTPAPERLAERSSNPFDFSERKKDSARRDSDADATPAPPIYKAKKSRWLDKRFIVLGATGFFLAGGIVAATLWAKGIFRAKNTVLNSSSAQPQTQTDPNSPRQAEPVRPGTAPDPGGVANQASKEKADSGPPARTPAGCLTCEFGIQKSGIQPTPPSRRSKNSVRYVAFWLFGHFRPRSKAESTGHGFHSRSLPASPRRQTAAGRPPCSSGSRPSGQRLRAVAWCGLQGALRGRTTRSPARGG
jgi:hypothetical protein